MWAVVARQDCKTMAACAASYRASAIIHNEAAMMASSNTLIIVITALPRFMASP
jgi:hypothetical protein